MALITQNMNQDPFKNVKGYDPTKIELDEQKDTVAGRISSLLDKDSRYLQAGSTRGLQRANKRGLVNSSMAMGAVENERIKAALPIATQDAATSYDARKTNVGASNRADEFGATASNQFAQQQLAGDQQLEQITRSGEVQKGVDTNRIQLSANVESGLMKERADIESRLQEESALLDRETRQQLQNRQAEIDEMLQTSRIGQTTDAESRLQGERADIQSRLQEEGALLDRETRQQLQDRQAEIDEMLQSQRIGQTGDVESRLQAERAEIQSRLQNEAATLDRETREALLNRQGEIDSQLQSQQAGYQMNLQELQNLGRQELAEIENKYQQQIQASQSAAVFYSQMAESIGAILANPEMDERAKQTQINRVKEQLEAGMNVIGGLAGMSDELSRMLNFDGSYEFPEGGGEQTASGPEGQLTSWLDSAVGGLFPEEGIDSNQEFYTALYDSAARLGASTIEITRALRTKFPTITNDQVTQAINNRPGYEVSPTGKIIKTDTGGDTGGTVDTGGDTGGTGDTGGAGDTTEPASLPTQPQDYGNYWNNLLSQYPEDQRAGNNEFFGKMAEGAVNSGIPVVDLYNNYIKNLGVPFQNVADWIYKNGYTFASSPNGSIIVRA